MYWTIVFSIEIHFGLTEFRARIKWTDNVSFLIVVSLRLFELMLISVSLARCRTRSDSKFLNNLRLPLEY